MPDVLLQTIPLAIVASTPLLLAVQGELVVQRSGIINLGIEGMILAAAFGAAFSGIGGGIGAALLVAMLFGWMTISLKADQIVTGTAINLLVMGVTGFAYREMQTRGISAPGAMRDFVTPIAWIVVPAALAIVLWRTTFGLRLRASGESPDAVLAAGLSPRRYRWSALMIEALLAGLAGSHLALVLSNGFAENMSAGRGFIALAVVIFGRWRILGAIAGSALFGVTVALQYALQASNVGVPYHLLLATPYVVTLLILCGLAGRVRAPEALGKS
jgi:general nucleoside transport system permease protein